MLQILHRKTWVRHFGAIKESEAIMSSVKWKIPTCSVVVVAASVGFSQQLKAETVSLNCLSNPGGMFITVDYSKNTVVRSCDGLPSEGGSPTNCIGPLPAEISATQIKYVLRIPSQPAFPRQITINRSTGALHNSIIGQQHLDIYQCEVYRGPPPKKF